MQAQFDRFEAVRKRVKEVADKAKALYGVDLSHASVRFDLRGRVAGWACCRRCRYTGLTTDVSFRFNRELIAGKHFEDMLNETVPHELAHGVCYLRPDLGRNHDAGWRRVCIALGGNGNARHSYDVSHAGGSIVYVSDRGHEIKLSKIRHAKIQAGITHYTLKGGRGRVDRYCAWAPEGQTPRFHLQRPTTPPPRPSSDWQKALNYLRAFASPQPTVPAVERKPVERPAAPTAGTSWADQVRALIRQARAGGRDEAWVIQQAINVLGMKPSSARNCTKANWQRA